MSDGQCCHEFCLGGCTGPKPDNCLVCRDVVFENRCLKQCPNQTYKVNQEVVKLFDLGNLKKLGFRFEGFTVLKICAVVLIVSCLSTHDSETPAASVYVVC